ncbi:MAG: hypothetical protein U9O89_02115 [Thermoproteota archaeon]|nr:hypothetical protein [Thermoproteota archaeon]
MIGAVVFVIFFAGFLALTFVLPVLPPGSMVYGFLGIEETYTIWGVSSDVLLKSVFNGVIYGFVVWLVFSVGTLYSKRRIGQVRVLVECSVCKSRWQEVLTKAQLQSMEFPKSRTLSRRKCPNCGKFTRPKIIKKV